MTLQQRPNDRLLRSLHRKVVLCETSRPHFQRESTWSHNAFITTTNYTPRYIVFIQKSQVFSFFSRQRNNNKKKNTKQNISM